MILRTSNRPSVDHEQLLTAWKEVLNVPPLQEDSELPKKANKLSHNKNRLCYDSIFMAATGKILERYSPASQSTIEPAKPSIIAGEL